ncbi:uncharacterized protein AB675_5624 [Cyphellophora attinorum]|uniref:F-box domain-containing protein n=1 Tax=Cyphellophora attinorum TaxID=1664694 RepID=A0A0N1H765_9EURO|nr:uncharacterized protein AB675_5624 [Phialophora attinorum]KPI42184.1 hypothetical protein AB675_5624 [Phialophora attinorum]
MAAQVQQEKTLAPLEELLPELVQKVATYLSVADLKSLRLSTRYMTDILAGQTFTKVTLASNYRSVERLSALPTKIRGCIKHVVFDMSYIYKEHKTIYDSEPRWRNAFARWNCLAEDCCATNPDGTPFFAATQFLSDFKQLENVRKVTITTADTGRWTRYRGTHDFGEDTVFYQILDAIRQLKQPLLELSMVTWRMNSMTFDMFRGYESIADKQGQTPMQILSRLRHLSLQLHYGEDEHLLSVSTNLRDTLRLMSETLQTLSIAILAQGYRYQARPEICA